MKTRHTIKVLQTLSLAASDAREDTLKSVIINTVFDKQTVAKAQLGVTIKEQYGFEPYADELNACLHSLIDSGAITSTTAQEYQLTDDEISRLRRIEIEERTRDLALAQNFKTLVIDQLGAKLENAQVSHLWVVFLEYLYLSFYEFGEDAIQNFAPTNSKVDQSNEDLIQECYKKLKDASLNPIFRQVIDKYPDYITKEELDFINSIALKTQSFASLGVRPEQAQEITDLKVVDWMLYLDTNVLYSLLGLHSHPENAACKALVKLITDNANYINVKLRYSDITLAELRAKKNDFSYIDTSLTSSAIKALLKSEKLDEFGRQFYSSLLENRDSTIHPSQVIDLAQTELKGSTIDIARTGTRVENIGESYLNVRIHDYLKFIDEKNAIKQKFCEDKHIPFKAYYRSDKQAKHDITLREIIISSRSGVAKSKEAFTMNSVRYYAVTLDDLLIQFDQFQRAGHTDERQFPVFFKPSYLLAKLVKILPIKTDDYKKAYIKAITSRGFNRDVKKTEDIVKIAAYLKSKGIDNEEVILNIVAEDIFLEKYRERSTQANFNSEKFIDDEVNRLFEQKSKELSQVKSDLDKTKSTALEVSSENEVLSKRFEEVKAQVGEFEKANKQLKSRVKKLETSQSRSVQGQIPFGLEEKDAEIAQLKATIAAREKSEKEEIIRSCARKAFVKWRLWGLVPLFITLPLLGFLIYWIVVNYGTAQTNDVMKLVYAFISAIIVAILNAIILGLFFKRWLDDSNIDSKRKTFESKCREKLENNFRQL